MIFAYEKTHIFLIVKQLIDRNPKRTIGAKFSRFAPRIQTLPTLVGRLRVKSPKKISILSILTV